MREELIVIQDPSVNQVSKILDALAWLARSSRYDRLRVAVAYASLAGCREFVSEMQRKMQNWDSVVKEWLISVDFGRTEPAALDFLRRLPRSQVRIPDASVLIGRKLVPTRCFHPKTYVFEKGINAAGGTLGVLVGSGNLTLSGLHGGVEHGLALLYSPGFTTAEETAMKELRDSLTWWNHVWSWAESVSASLVKQYDAIRPRLPREDDAITTRDFSASESREIERSQGMAWANARCLWVETYELYKNLGRARPGNQVDLKRGTRVFFGFSAKQVALNTVFGSITLQYEDMPARSRSVRYGNNQMDKINLPIPGEDGPGSYDNSFLHFERVGDKAFRVTLAKPDEEKEWIRKSASQGMLHEMSGGRKFGFYS